MPRVLRVSYSRSLALWRDQHPETGRRGVALAVTALVHLVLLFLVWQAKLVGPREQEAARVSTVRLIPDANKTADSAQPSSSMRTPPPMGSPPTLTSLQGLHTQIDLLPDSSDWVGGAARDSITDADRPQSFGRVGLDGAAHLPAGPASGPQRLATRPSREVLKGSLANPATLDPRSNSPRPSMEEKIALDLNPDLCLKEERLPDGTIRRALVKRKEVPSAAQAYTSIKTARLMICP